MGSGTRTAGSDLFAPLLKTKLEAPGCPRLVVRDGLIEALSAGLSLPVTLVYGPAGSGKTMLVAQWLASARDELPAAWLSLDGADNDPARFWIYVVEALRSTMPGFGAAVLSMLRAPGVALVDGALSELSNALLDFDRTATLVLDDYHVIDDERIHRGMGSLLERLPKTLRIVIVSRAEPPLGVGTLRARGQLSEIDAARLRFSRSEAETLLNDVHGLDLPSEMVDRLHDRTEGWAAGLYLAVLSLRGRDDVSGFIESFAGSDRLLVDYLGAEILAGLSEEELDFLVSTGVLDRLSAPLCEAVTGIADARTMLDRIERSNYFLIPLDPSHDWYRYHHLFGELLRHELDRRGPESVAGLHRRAGRWYHDAGLVADAIGHLTAAGDLEEVSDLISTHWLSFTNLGQRATVARWLGALPQEHVRGDGRLCLAQARTAAVVGNRGEIVGWIDQAERASHHNPSEDAWLAEQATTFRSIALELCGDMGECSRVASALEPLDGTSFWHGLLACNVGAAAHWRGDGAEAVKLLDDALAFNRDEIAMCTLFARGQLALIAAESGDWRACAAHCLAGFDFLEARGLEEYWQCSLLHTARARSLQHDRRLDEARSELDRALTLARRGTGVVELAYILVTLAELLREIGDRGSARELVLEAREVLAGAPDPGTLVPDMVARAEAGLRLVLQSSSAGPVVTDALTAREQAVLRLLPSGLSAREIGSELSVSRETIRTHTANLYRKLGASNRRDAIARARDLELL